MLSWVALPIAVALVTTSAGLDRQPTLRTAGAAGEHIVVTFSTGELVPGEVAIAVAPSRTASGGFPRANLRLIERITATTSGPTGTVRFRTHGTVHQGVYYVAVSGFVQEPPPSCMPITSHCTERWSNVRRVVVRSASS